MLAFCHRHHRINHPNITQGLPLPIYISSPSMRHWKSPPYHNRNHSTSTSLTFPQISILHCMGVEVFLFAYMLAFLTSRYDRKYGIVQRSCAIKNTNLSVYGYENPRLVVGPSFHSHPRQRNIWNRPKVLDYRNPLTY